MSELGLGKLITTPQQKDAIHVAVVPVMAGQDLDPGTHVGIVGVNPSEAFIKAKTCGVVDPYLIGKIKKGQTFWLLMYPNTVTNLRHDWSHAEFPEQPLPTLSEQEQSIAWMKEAARSLGVSYDALIGEWSSLESGDYINNGEHIRDIWYDISDEFWKHHKIITGRDVSQSNRGGFTCSC